MATARLGAEMGASVITCSALCKKVVKKWKCGLWAFTTSAEVPVQRVAESEEYDLCAGDLFWYPSGSMEGRLGRV
jgi:hypothetical protein